MTCNHSLSRLMYSSDYPGKIYCKDCEKRFECVGGHFVEWIESPEGKQEIQRHVEFFGGYRWATKPKKGVEWLPESNVKTCICSRLREAGKWCGTATDYCGASCESMNVPEYSSYPLKALTWKPCPLHEPQKPEEKCKCFDGWPHVLKDDDPICVTLCPCDCHNSADEREWRRELLDTLEEELNKRQLANPKRMMNPKNIMLGSVEYLRKKYL